MAAVEEDKILRPWTEGDTKPDLGPIVLEGVNITGFTINFRYHRNNASVLLLSATILDASQGEFVLQWSPTDLVPGCNQLIDIEIIDTAGEPFTERVFIDVNRKTQ